MAVFFAAAVVGWTSVVAGWTRQMFPAAMIVCGWSLAGATYLQTGRAKLRVARWILATVGAAILTFAMSSAL